MSQRTPHELCRGWDAILIWIDSKTGFLLFEDKAGKDVFPDMVRGLIPIGLPPMLNSVIAAVVQHQPSF